MYYTYDTIGGERVKALYKVCLLYTSSGNARFYITEEPAVISESLIGEISRAMSESDRTEDVKNYLQGLYENENLDEEKYEELVDSEEFLQKAVELFDKMEDCNTPFNTTMELAVDEARKEMAI